MLTERLQRVVERAAMLPPESQDAVAEVFDALIAEYGEPWPDEAPKLSPELDAIVERAIRDHADMLEYLKDK